MHLKSDDSHVEVFMRDLRENNLERDTSMSALFWRTFGGLAPAYYFRHFFFGLMFPVLMYFGNRDNLYPPGWQAYVYSAVSTLLYPYSRFVYESVVGFVLGRNVFFVNGGVLLVSKFVTMLACWVFAVFVAPIGLLYLYLRGSRVD